MFYIMYGSCKNLVLKRSFTRTSELKRGKKERRGMSCTRVGTDIVVYTHTHIMYII